MTQHPPHTTAVLSMSTDGKIAKTLNFYGTTLTILDSTLLQRQKN